MNGTHGVEVILDDLENNPSCPHGPTILFKRTTDGNEHKFYACAACRDRKDCNFFLKFEDKWTEEQQRKMLLRKSKVLPNIDHSKLVDRLRQVSQLLEKDRAYCHTCDMLLLPSEWVNHNTHNLRNHLSNHLLCHPSEVLNPLESAKKEAQYLFAEKSTRVIVNLLRSAGIVNVLCVGAPRVHELIKTVHPDMRTFLLDFDHRYHQFYDAPEFSWFNAFNCYWFLGDTGKEATIQFMKQGIGNDFAIVTDPPFGGRVEPLAYSFQCLDKLHLEHHQHRDHPLPLLWIFPYFMEPMIKSSCPNMFMLDYKVDYDNHPLFQEGSTGRKHGSPVRIFTNISPSKLPLPQEEGYWYCDVCEKWSSPENKHCYKCNECTSKDGRTYVHCERCKRCVKPTWLHCSKCKRCCLPDHSCGKFKPLGCFACHKSGHKKNECPLRINEEETHSANQKRKRSKSSGGHKESEMKKFSAETKT